LIDFKKEIQKYKPAQQLDDLHNGIVTGEITDITDILIYLLREDTGKSSEKPRGNRNETD